MIMIQFVFVPVNDNLSVQHIPAPSRIAAAPGRLALSPLHEALKVNFPLEEKKTSTMTFLFHFHRACEM